MKKRVLSLLLVLGMSLGLCGCTALFKKEYLSVSQYTEGDYDDYEGYFSDVSDFEGLKSAIIKMVAEHSEEERIRFTDYDGNPQSDLAQAGWEVKAETSLASYVVDYMSYDPKSILNYYEATIYIAYKHTQKDVESIIEVPNLEALTKKLGPALNSLSNYEVFHIPNAALTEDDVLSAVLKAYTADPVSCVVMPTAQVQLHPKSGVFRIAEIELYYGRTDAILGEMKRQLTQKLTDLSGSIQKEDKFVFALDAYNLLASNCDYDPDGVLRRERGLESDLGSTIYGAIVESCADSQGIAVAFSALCASADIPCIVVEGSVDKTPHFWNIIELNGTYFHVDVSADSTWGMNNSFLMSDEQMQSRYWWNIEDYPECPKTRN